MTSKISSVKLLKESLKRGSAMTALLSILYFCIYPLGLMMAFSQWPEDMTRAYILEQVEGWIAYNPFAFVCMLGIAVILGIWQFAYVDSREKLDFYHSFPVKRERFFLIQYISGILIFIVPFGVSILLAMLLTGIRGYLSAGMVILCVKGVIVQCVSFLLIYSLMILAMMLTGKIFTAILGMGVFSFYIPAAAMILVGLGDTYYVTHCYGNRMIESAMNWSPFYLCMRMSNAFRDPDSRITDMILAMFLVALLIGMLAMYFYRKRDGENAGKAMVFPRLAKDIKFLLVILLSLGCHVVFTNINTYGADDVWGMFGLAFGFLLSTAVIEFIYCMDIREIFSDKKQIVVTFAVLLCTMMYFRFDIGGFDRWLPSPDEVESVSIRNDYNSSLLFDNMQEVYRVAPDADGNMVYQIEGYVDREMPKVTDMEVIYGLMEKRLDRKEYRLLREQGYYGGIEITWNMKNGSQKQRYYHFTEEAISENFKDLWAVPGYKEQLLPVLTVPEERILTLNVADGFADRFPVEAGIKAAANEDGVYEVAETENAEEANEDGVYEAAETEDAEETIYKAEFADTKAVEEQLLPLTREQKKELFHTFKEEFTEKTIDEMVSNISSVSDSPRMIVLYPEKDGSIMGETFYLSGAFTKTRALLKEYGYPFKKKAG